MATDRDIRSLIRDYLDGDLTFETFEDSFLDETWDVRPDQFAHVPEIVFTVERYIAELTGDYRTETDFRAALELLAPSWIGASDAHVKSTTTRPGRMMTSAGA